MKKILSGIIFTTAVFCGMFFTSNVVSAATLQDRLCGNNRYETNSKIVDSGWTSSEYAVIASGQGFADALCAAPLAEKNKAPILLTSRDALSSEAKEQLTKLKVKKVFIVGGTASVSNNVKSEITNMNIETTRIYGKNRFETSLEVAKVLGNINGVVVTNGYGFADALSIAPIAAKKGIPILLTDKDDLSTPIKEFLHNSSYNESYIVGGTGVVSNKIASQLNNVTRLGGNSRYGTNSAILDHFANDFSYDKVYVASGENYPDALSGSVLAASSNSPLILVGNSIDPSVVSSIKPQHDKYNNVVVLGGTGVVSDFIVNDIISGVFTVVTFKDINVEKVVRNLINKPTGDIYNCDVEKITSLNIDYRGVKYIDGIENLTNLQDLTAGENQISDLSPLKNLTNLQYIYLNNNQISDISPLKELYNLKKLYLGASISFDNNRNLVKSENVISDVSPLKDLTNLQELNLGFNQINDISPLEGLYNLRKLYLFDNEVSDYNAQSLQNALPDCSIDFY